MTLHTARASLDGRKNFSWHDCDAIQTSNGDQVMLKDSSPGVENQNDERFFARIKPVGLRDVVPPVFSCSFWCINHFGWGDAFSDSHHLKFMGWVHFFAF